MTADVPRVGLVGTHDPTFGRISLLAEGLRRRGYPVTSCVEPTWGSTAERVSAARRGLRNPRLIWRLASAYIRIARCLAAQRPTADVLLIGYPGQLDAVVLRGLKPRARIVLDAFTSLDETLADRRIGTPDAPIRRVARAVDRLAFRLADRVVVDTAAHRRRFAAECGLDPGRAVVVPVGARDFSLPFPSPPVDHEAGPARAQPGEADGSASRREGPEPALRVLYFGGFVPLHGVGIILEAARLIPPDAGIRLELLGDGQEADAAERFLRQVDLPHVKMIRGWLPEADVVAQHIARSDVCLGVFADAPKAMDVVPAKVYLAMACGRPIVTADTPAVREEVLDRAPAAEPPVLPCPSGDPRALATALLRLRDDPALRRRVGAAARRLYEACFRPECIVDPLAAVIDELSARAPG